MKKYAAMFCQRGLAAAAGGPVILAIIYAILGMTGAVEAIAPAKACTEILTITLMAFIAAGITTIYTVERLPLISAILIHAGVLYLDYLLVYLANGWFPANANGVLIFSIVFFAGYALVWACIYLVIRKKTQRVNAKIQARA